MKKNTFLKYVVFLFCLSLISAFSYNPFDKEWKLGIQAFTFHKFSFVETLEKVRELNLKYIEIYFGQRLGEGFEGNMDYRMDAVKREKIIQLARSKGIIIYACGVVTCKDENEWMAVFDFAAGMGIKIITCEPQPVHIELVEQLAKKHRIDIAIHNHPKPSSYWEPELVLKAIEGRTRRFGACADVGHWKRMGIEPLDGLRKYDNRIKCLHMKDVSSGDPEAHDVIWGQGVCNVPGILEELNAQDFNGLLSIEYEYNWENSVPDIKQCISFFEQEVSLLNNHY